MELRNYSYYGLTAARRLKPLQSLSQVSILAWL